jgi:hypothetical protein
MSSATKKHLSNLSVVAAAAPVANLGAIGANLYVDYTTRNDNTGGGTEVDLSTFTVKGGTLNTDGDSLMFYFSGEKFGGLTTELQIYVNGTSIMSPFNGTVTGPWTLFMFLTRTGASSMKVSVTGLATNNTPVQRTTTQGATLSSDFVVKLTSKTTSTGSTPYNSEYTFLCNYIRSA